MRTRWIFALVALGCGAASPRPSPVARSSDPAGEGAAAPATAGPDPSTCSTGPPAVWEGAELGVSWHLIETADPGRYRLLLGGRAVSVTRDEAGCFLSHVVPYGAHPTPTSLASAIVRDPPGSSPLAGTPSPATCESVATVPAPSWAGWRTSGATDPCERLLACDAAGCAEARCLLARYGCLDSGTAAMEAEAAGGAAFFETVACCPG